jgi:hypothetical protein
MRRSVYLPYCLVLACAWPIDMHSQARNDSTIVQLDSGTRLTPLEQTILDKEKETCDRAIKTDFKGWEALIYNDALAVYSDGYATKAEVLKVIKTMIGGHCLMDKVRFTTINKKAGLITYRMTQDWEEGGKRQSRQYYISSLWVNRGGKWISSFWQETDTTPESQVAKNEDAEEAGISSQNTPFSDANAGQVPPDSFFIAKEKQDWEALKHKDKATATRLLADDFVGMYDFGFFNKSEWVKQMDEEYSIDDYSIESARVLHPSANTALLLYNSNCKGTGTWTESCFHTWRISDLYVERNGQWLALFSQDTQATSNDSDEAVLKEILASETRIVDALSRDDIEGFAKLLPDDVIDIDDDGIHTKAEWIPEMQEQKDRGFLFRDFRFDDPKLIRLGPNEATFTAKEIIHELDKGKPVEERYYTNATYVRRNGKWQPRVYQDTPMVK